MKRIKTTLYLNPKLKALLKHLAVDKKVSLSDLINEMLEKK